MLFILKFTEEAEKDLNLLKLDAGAKSILKPVLRALGLMEVNLRHPSLNTHEFKGLKGPLGQKVFEAYAQQNTPSAYRIIWCYGPDKNMLTIIAIVPHPD